MRVWRGNRNREKEQPSAGFGFSGLAESYPSRDACPTTVSERSILARSGTDFVAGAACSQGQVQISWQTQQFRKVRYRFRGRRNTFASKGAITFSSCSSKIAKVKYKSSIRSTLLQLQLENGKSRVQK